jgi:HAE1 family hydrophobic/amphiphilic exporter-1
MEKEPVLSKFSLDRRISVLMLAVTIAVIGSIAALGIPAEMLPRGFVDSFLYVFVPWQDAPAGEVLDKITIPLEENLNTVKGVDRVTSVSFQGGTRVFIWFKQSTDMDVAYREVRDRVERARVDFPDDVDQVFINKDDASGMPVYMIGIGVDPELDNPWDLIQNEVITPLERVEGVASISYFGLEEKEVLIEIDREKSNAAGLNIFQLAQDLGDDNFTMASGTVQTGSRKLLLRSVASFDSIDQLENRLVGVSTRLKDIATITYAEPEKKYRARINGSPAVAVRLIKEAEANTRETTKKIALAFEKLKKNPRLANLEMVSFFDQGEIIDEALGTLINSGLFGGVLASIVLFFFMRRIRLTLIVAFSIPLSLVLGLTGMYFAGETLNLLSLIGLMICIGLLVDNSVVVAENIYRLRDDGNSRRDSCIRGAGEVGLAITMSTLTTVVVFLPAALIEGPAGFFLTRLALPVAVSVVGSLLVALIFIPICVYLTLKPTGVVVLGASDQPAKIGAIERLRLWVDRLLEKSYELTFGKLNVFYNKILSGALDKRFGVVFSVFLVMVVSVGACQNTTEFVGQQDDEQAQFNMQFELPASTTLEEASAYFDDIEATMQAHKAQLGLDGFFVYHENTDGQLDAWFDRELKGRPTVKESLEILVEAFPERPGFEVFTGSEQQASEKSQQIETIFIRGEDPAQVAEVTDELAGLFLQVEGVLGRRKAGGETPNELGLVIDREKAQHLNVNPQVIAGVVGYALRGQSLPKFQADGREVPVRVRYKEKDRQSMTELESFLVPTGDGSMLPLSALTDTTVLPQATSIVRRDKMVGRSITLELEEGAEAETRNRLAQLQSSIDLPEGMSFGGSRQLQSVEDEFAGIQFAVTLSIILIYLLMGFLFESFILPMSILITIPLSSIGMMWGHVLTGRDVDFLGAVAMILLIGIVVNNGIVLIDYVNRLRERGHSRKEAILLATQRRFRPIMMTAITTIGGMIPLALAGANSIGLSYTSFSITLIGGLSTATLLTLLVVPVFYTMFDDLRAAMQAAIRPLRAPKMPEVGPETAPEGATTT